MKKLQNTTDIRTVNCMNETKGGKFRFVAKNTGGFMSISEARPTDNLWFFSHPNSLLTAYKKGSLQTIEFCPEGKDFYLTVFARNGKKIILIDEKIMADIEIGTINQLWYNTNLYSQAQYTSVNAKTWADKAFVVNSEEIESIQIK